MSYAIVKSIKVENNKVFITSADNNVWPRTPHKWQCSHCENWQKNGYPSVEVCILSGYEEGNFQAGRENKFTLALEALRRMPEYQALDWRSPNNWDESQKNRQAFKETLFNLMIKALATKLPAKSFAITKDVGGMPAYFRHRKNSRACKWYYDKTKATLFRFQEDAEKQKSYFYNSEDWQVVKIK